MSNTLVIHIPRYCNGLLKCDWSGNPERGNEEELILCSAPGRHIMMSMNYATKLKAICFCDHDI